MLLEPSGLPIGLWNLGGELLVRSQYVRIPLAPLACAPSRRIGGCMHHMGDLGRRHAGFEPFLGFEVDIDRARSRERGGATDVVEQDLGQSAVADRSEGFRESFHAIA